MFGRYNNISYFCSRLVVKPHVRHVEKRSVVLQSCSSKSGKFQYTQDGAAMVHALCVGLLYSISLYAGHFRNLELEMWSCQFHASFMYIA